MLAYVMTLRTGVCVRGLPRQLTSLKTSKAFTQRRDQSKMTSLGGLRNGMGLIWFSRNRTAGEMTYCRKLCDSSTQTSAHSTTMASLNPTDGLQILHMDKGDRTLDWEQIDSEDMDKMMTQNNVDILQKYFKALTLHDLAQESCINCKKPLDTALLKGFRLAQLSIVYLYTCQEILITDLQATKKKMSADAGMLEQMLEAQGGLHKLMGGLEYERVKSTDKKLNPQLACNRCPRCGLSCEDSAIYRCHCQHPDKDTTIPPGNCSGSEVNGLKEVNDYLKQELKARGSSSMRLQLENSILKEQIVFLQQRANARKSKKVRFLLPDGTITESESNQRKRLMNSILKTTKSEKIAGVKETRRRQTAKHKKNSRAFTQRISTLTTWMRSRFRKKKKSIPSSQWMPVFSPSELSSPRQASHQTEV